MSLICGADFSSRGTSLFGEYICKLTIELLSLLCFRLSQTITISLFERRDTLIVFPLTVGIQIEVFVVNLYVTNQFVSIQIVLLLDISFDLLSQFLKFRSESLLPVIFCLCMSFIPFWNIPSNPMSTTIFCYQHEFRSKLNCETQLIQFVQDLLDKLREGGQTNIIVMDFRKASDRVSHQRLLLKPHRTGINSSVVISPTDVNFWFLIITKTSLFKYPEIFITKT